MGMMQSVLLCLTVQAFFDIFVDPVTQQLDYREMVNTYSKFF